MRLNAAKRNALSASQFGWPAKRKYPDEDAGHARDGLARAKQMLNRGRITKARYESIVKRLKAALKRFDGGAH